MELTKKVMANMRNVSRPLNKMEGKKKVIAAFTETVEEVDKDNGDIKRVPKGYIATEDGEYYGTISATAIRNINDIIDLLADGEEVEVSVLTRKSNAGRDFISLVME